MKKQTICPYYEARNKKCTHKYGSTHCNCNQQTCVLFMEWQELREYTKQLEKLAPPPIKKSYRLPWRKR